MDSNIRVIDRSVNNAEFVSRGCAAVVGANGFIGQHLVRELRNKKISVLSFTNSYPVLVDSNLAPELSLAQTIYIVSGSVTPVSANENPLLVTEELKWFKSLLTALSLAGAACNERTKVVLASSGGTIYGDKSVPPYCETDNSVPVNEYGRMKLEMERLLLCCKNIQPVVLRLANIYGPGQRPRRGLGVIAHWLDAAANNRPIKLYGNPTSTRDYLYVKDAVDFMIGINDPKIVLPSVINVGSGMGTSLEQVAQCVEQVTGKSPKPIKSEGRITDRSEFWLDIELAEKYTGWSPSVSLDAGIAEAWRNTFSTGYSTRKVKQVARSL